MDGGGMSYTAAQMPRGSPGTTGYGFVRGFAKQIELTCLYDVSGAHHNDGREETQGR
jgi:hypothetical protein